MTCVRHEKFEMGCSECISNLVRQQYTALGPLYPKRRQEKEATTTQIGGDHYSKMIIQPMEYSMKNGLDACQHTAIKYISRFRDKGGIEDLEKAKHVIDMLIQFEKEKAQ